MSPRVPPGPSAFPLLGHVVGLLRDPLAFLTQLTREYGDVATFYLGRTPAVFINHPALIERVIRDRDFERGEHTRRGLAVLLGQGLLSLEGAPHLRHRRLMQPAFHRERIERYVSIMADETYATISRWRDGELLDLREQCMRLTFAIVARCLVNADTQRAATRVDAILQRVLPPVTNSTMLSRIAPFHLPPLFGPGTHRSIRELHELVDGMVRERRSEGGDRGDLLSMLLASRDEDGSALSDDDVRAEALTILLAGHDTTAHTLNWAGYLLATHPEIQQAVANEVRTVAGDRRLTSADLMRLTLVDRVIRETLRLYPPAWWADRACSSAVELGGFEVPANRVVVFSAYVTQRDPRNFAQPDRFDPDRFSPERAAAIPDGAYVPFGAGVHTCIGNTFAMAEARMILAALAQRFALRALHPERVRPRALVTLGMAEPFPVVLTARGVLDTRAAS